MTTLVHDSGYIKSKDFIFTGKKYEVISSEIGVNNSIWSTIDTVRREDGVERKFTRKELRGYFVEVELVYSE